MGPEKSAELARVHPGLGGEVLEPEAVAVPIIEARSHPLQPGRRLGAGLVGRAPVQAHE
jgi:hypothetical protein